nr:HD domain-containing protein [Candidatus Sigynarchaeota archaeon]
MEKRLNPVDSKDLERAITFLVDYMNTSGHNPKPVILHSILTGMKLLRYGYRKELVIAGLLHDVLEDSDAKESDINSLFGEEVTELVKALTFKEEIRYDVNKYINAVKQKINAGEDACIIDTADRFTNLPYICMAQNNELFYWLIKKAELSIKMEKDLLKNEAIYKDLKKEFNKVKKQELLKLGSF